MAEGTYEYECMRAELLGVEKPSREDFEQKMRLQEEAGQEELISEQMREVDLQDEQMQGASGKMDELNNILSITQQRINKFKVACGSLTSLLRFRPSTPNEGATSNQASNESSSNTIDDALDTLDSMKEVQNASEAKIAKSAANDLGQKMTSQLDKLDSLIYRADNAAYSMNHQTKQMKQITK
ncbi:uncharacterized protein LOC129777818 [Toxorhynchites rutilus septentrionalis]|uniref:uncharacterized protein LOC129777818 n=1 Tax=Toxorhynchites rutilus septentrionalis TaxID=329112 RepID=UPI00247B2D9F|nr:uncharacterized protein LOC129777818 [Toxorhynchites rutilus septentrionalis]